eukprot:TRINITY_DN1494_c0_g1_i1.p1 TRINITY_DN1494_c0_g1~~TRINITY_DN1494_c0_g1_i1.p1  ORF type:complete len:492 (+),score=134.56 TRINITY_DN1494_c0_g1_i1:76-1551(+)
MPAAAPPERRGYSGAAPTGRAPPHSGPTAQPEASPAEAATGRGGGLPVRVADIPGKGRGLVATRDVAAGEVVVAEPPLVVYADEKQFAAVCARCLGAVGGAKERCSGGCGCCYCSAECAEKHRGELHPTAVCAVYRRLLEQPQGAAAPGAGEMRDAARYLAVACALASGAARPHAAADGRAAAADGPAAFAVLRGLCSGWEGTDEMDGVRLQQAAALYLSVAEGCPFSAAELVTLLQAEQQNSLGMAMPRTPGEPRELRGTCLYGLVSMANHSCYPNAARQDYLEEPAGTHRLPPGAPRCTTVIRALQAVPKGQEVCISYAPLEYRVDERKQHLYEAYGICCRCSRCRLEERLEREAEAEEEGEEAEEGQEEADGDERGEEEENEEEDQGSNEGTDGASGEALYHVFMTRFLCPGEGCGGTLVPFRLAAEPQQQQQGDAAGAPRQWPSADAPEAAGHPSGCFECNTCYSVRTEADFIRAMEADVAAAHAGG